MLQHTPKTREKEHRLKTKLSEITHLIRFSSLFSLPYGRWVNGFFPIFPQLSHIRRTVLKHFFSKADFACWMLRNGSRDLSTH